jgi:hypothetical protein
LIDDSLVGRQYVHGYCSITAINHAERLQDTKVRMATPIKSRNPGGSAGIYTTRVGIGWMGGIEGRLSSVTKDLVDGSRKGETAMERIQELMRRECQYSMMVDTIRRQMRLEWELFSMMNVGKGRGGSGTTSRGTRERGEYWKQSR